MTESMNSVEKKFRLKLQQWEAFIKSLDAGLDKRVDRAYGYTFFLIRDYNHCSTYRCIHGFKDG
jgi:hypothetical protein